MKFNSNWRSLTHNPDIESVSGVRSLVPGHPGLFQFLSGSQEFLAIKSRRPYGTLTETAFTEEAGSLHLLPATGRGEDYVAFELTEDMIALRAATLGSDQRRAEMLIPIYQDVGRVILEMAQKTTLPILELGDFALRKTTGDIVFVPPVNFGYQDFSVSKVIQGLTASIGSQLASWNPSKLQTLTAALKVEGI